jgi:putative membrane protein
VIGLLVRTVIAVAANAIGLVVAAIALDGVDINVASFVVAVVIFTIVFSVLTPFLAVQLRRLGNGAIGATALIATLVSLIVTDLVSDGFSISGVGTWIAAAVIVWLAALVAAFVLPFLGLKKYLGEREHRA